MAELQWAAMTRERTTSKTDRTEVSQLRPVRSLALDVDPGG
jgi:hypothetical protein